ncbi:GGDEF domain-containing protein [Mycobacteroides immunogenum]|nr:GGDEF domain-containing protein [Mycobacteroides immunogenum]KIU41755.1 hypothetical protein TL11_04255 [Mycobacteroides immunogenum]MCV7304283.1 GGDEF domain-containing protein [Mycobacteroides immunogenum]WJR33566.1 GGDEF domain-containing protein [Mycobacteroides immunogenum]
MEFLRKWWTEPVPPGWLQSYLEANGLDRSLRTLIGWYALVFAAICVVAQFSNAAPTTLFGRAVVGVCAIGSLAWALRWFVGSWASRTESMIFVAFADVGIAASASQLSTDLSLGTAMLFTPIGAYVSFFLGNRQLLAHAIWCITVICALAVPLAVPGPAEIVARVIAMAICQMLVVVLVPVVIQFGIAMVRLQAMASWRDPLTGIFNRRGIFDEWQRKHRALVAGDEIAHGRVVAVATVDIDRYKLVNDTHGHDAGDRVLIECAEALSEQHDSRTIVGRSGGDEFLVITLCAAESISDLARALGDRIATCAPTDLAVTASIGIATDSVIAVTAADPQSAIESLISRADIAMYEAKRNGGNQFRIAPQCVNDRSP